MKISTKVECGIIAIADIAMNSENGVGGGAAAAGVGKDVDFQENILSRCLLL